MGLRLREMENIPGCETIGTNCVHQAIGSFNIAFKLLPNNNIILVANETEINRATSLLNYPAPYNLSNGGWLRISGNWLNFGNGGNLIGMGYRPENELWSSLYTNLCDDHLSFGAPIPIGNQREVFYACGDALVDDGDTTPYRKIYITEMYDMDCKPIRIQSFV